MRFLASCLFHSRVIVRCLGKGYQCEQCDRIFTESGSLRRHVLSIHEEIRYPCDECDYKVQNKIVKEYKYFFANLTDKI